MSSHKMMPDEIRIALPHVQQLYNWDCGLACTQMILSFCEKSTDDFEDNCQKLNFDKSIWTIDLVNLIWLYKLRHHFCTQTLGVNLVFSNKKFYKNTFSLDEERVNHLFEDAAVNGLSVEKRQVEMSEIIQHLSEGNIIIVLIDWNHLVCQWCKSSLKSCFLCVTQCFTDYQGHFIVVCGYNSAERLIYYKNPSSDKELCCCSMSNFEAARKQEGTDEDIIFIYKDHTTDNVG